MSGVNPHGVYVSAFKKPSDEELDHETPLEELFEDQLACADMILLNKTDLLDGATVLDMRQPRFCTFQRSTSTKPSLAA